MSNSVFGLSWGEGIAIAIDGAILLFVFYDFLMHRRNRPRLELEITDTIDTGDNVYGQQWIINNTWHDTALNVEATFQLTPEQTPRNPVTILVKHFPISRKGSLGPTKMTNEWIGLSLFILKDSQMFSLVSADEEVKGSTIATVNHTFNFPVGKYQVQISVAGENLRDEDRATKTYVLEFPDGLPKMRLIEKGEPFYAKWVSLNLIDIRSKSPSPSPESSPPSSSLAPSKELLPAPHMLRAFTL